MKTLLRKEEFTALGDFILASFERDQAAIVAKFPKFDNAFLTEFTAKLDFVKHMEGRLVKTEEQKGVTQNLYRTADELGQQLTYINSYMADAGLNTTIIPALKRDLYNRNIEGAILKAEDLKAYINSHHGALEAEGMDPDFPTVLGDFKATLENYNSLQNQYMSNLKQLTETNTHHYEELYGFIKKIATKGKLVFKDTVKQDEYSIKKCVGRMRTMKLKKDTESDAA